MTSADSGPDPYYFAYGSNMNPQRMRDRRVGFEQALPAVLADFSLVFNKRSSRLPGTSSANVVATPGQRVEGVLYRLVDSDEILKLDPFEGYPDVYTRCLLPVAAGPNGSCRAWIYLAQPAHLADGLHPARSYVEHLLAGREFLSQAYFDWLRGIRCIEGL